MLSERLSFVYLQPTNKNNDHGKQKNLFRKGNDAKHRRHNLIAHRRIAYVNDVDVHSRIPRLGMVGIRTPQL